MRLVVLSLLGLCALQAVAAETSKTLGATAGVTDTQNANRVRTQFSPKNEVTISSEISAKIAYFPLREGDTFKTGQTLVSFDCSLFQAQLNKAQASMEGARQALDTTQRLNALESAGASEVQQAEAKNKETQAEVAYMQTTVKKCSIAAPFSGSVAKRKAANHQYVTTGTPLLDLIDNSSLELQLIVPSRWLAWLKKGSTFTVQVDELGKTVDARVQSIGARIDPVSQTVNITGVVSKSVPNLLPGMSGWASFAQAK